MRINKESVGNVSTESVNAFFNKYYVVNNMTLFVISSKPAYEIEKIIAKCFGSVPNRPIENSFIGQPIFKEDTLRRVYYVNSTSNSSFIYFDWVFPIEYDKLVDLKV